MEKTIDTEQLLLQAINAAIDAGKAILEVYRTPFSVELKGDNSPLTEADRKANAVIEKYLQPSAIPILSEEGKAIAYDVRKNWNYFWLVDPLDGTKEFIKKNGEFTVNIALMKGQYPVAGVIYVPDKHTLYLGAGDRGSYRLEGVKEPFAELDQMLQMAEQLPKSKGDRKFTIVGSKSHPSPETQEFIEELSARKGEVEVISMGSSLKLCLVAEGTADAYPRFAPTMEWDTAAGQAVAEASGARVINWSTKSRMAYNKENLLNDWFLVERPAAEQND